MIGKLFKYIDSRLWLRVVTPLSGIVIIVVFASVWYNVSYQKESGEMQLKNQNILLSQVVEGGMFDALSTGDNDVVRAQFKRLSEMTQDLKVFVYDFNGIVSFSTDSKMIGKDVTTNMGDLSKKDVSSMLETGKASDKAFSITFDDTFLLNNTPILNESRCFHCHGESRKILGGISVFSSERSIQTAIAKGKINSILIGVIGLVLIIVFFYLFFHFLVDKKIQTVLGAMSYLRQGDFTHTHDVSDGDEINHILARINIVTQNLREIIHQIVDNSDTINNSASDLSHISENLSSASTDVSDKAMTVSAAAEEMSVNNQSVASSMEQSTETLHSIVSAIEEMSQTISEISSNVNSSKKITIKMVEGFEIITRVVGELGKGVNDVDTITDEIRSIAEQVSMLALNAKIEAARAGDAGKGFAIVAQEITELASKTNESTIQADEKLKWIKDKSKEVSQKVNGLTTIVQDSDDAISIISTAVEQQDLTTKEISKNINEISTEISIMNNSVTEGASAAAEIAKEITIVESGSRQVQESSNSLNTNAMALSTMAENFMELVKKFKV